MSQPQRGTGRGRGRPAIKHSRKRIVDEAMAIATEQGFAAVSIRSVARRLGTSPTSLYRHVRSRGDLVGAAVDQLLETEPPLNPPPAELWDERVRWAGAYLLDVFARYPAVRSLFMAGPVPSQRLLMVLELVLDSLSRAGCRPEDAADIDFLLTTAVVGFAGLEEQHRGTFASRKDRIAFLRDEMDRLPRERYPRIFSASDRLQQFVERVQFERNVELVVEAARVRIEAVTTAPNQAPAASTHLFTMLEEKVLDYLLAGDRTGLSQLLTDDFVITSAGWLSGPVDRTTWLAELGAQHRLTGFEMGSIDVRRHGDTAVVLLQSTQRGERHGNPWTMEFRYTDLWVPAADAWLLAARHASGRPLGRE